MEIKDHKLIGADVVFSALNEKAVFGNGLPDTIIIHYTAGSSDKSAIAAMKARGLSAHLVVSAVNNIKITQLVHFNKAAIHAGRSAYTLNGVVREGFNASSIGIEIDNAGPISKIDGKCYTWWTANQKTNPLPDSAVLQSAHRNKATKGTLWAKYPQNQIDRVFEICRSLCKNYPIKYILGHEEIAPGRKSDPGPAFPLDKLREDLFKEGYPSLKDPKLYVKTPHAVVVDEPEIGELGEVTADVLNIRAGAGQNFNAVTAPVAKGTQLEILDVQGDWLKVNYYAVIGWVAKEYIDADNSDEPGDAVVIVKLLNIRNKPNGEKMAEPLKEGTKVGIIRQDEGWCNVGVTLKATGWVAKQFVKTV